MIDDQEFGGKSFPLRPSERYGGREAVGSVLWLEHAEGITFTNEDGSTVLLHPEDLAKDEAAAKGSPFSKLRKAMAGDTLLLAKEQWLREYVLRMLPLRIAGDPAQPPLLFKAELEVFTVPQELTVNPGVIAQTETITNDEGEERDLTRERAISFGLRLIPERGQIKDYGYYPSGMRSEEGIGALEVTPDLIRMQLHNRIYLELYRSPQKQAPGPLIAPHQF